MKIRADLIRLYKAVHIWVGIVSGLALFIAFYAGALTMFHDPIRAWAQTATPLAPPPSWAQTPELIDKVVRAHPEAGKDYTIHLGDDVPARMSWVVYPGGQRARGVDPALWQASLDAQGQPQVAQVSAPAVAHVIDDLHQNVGLPFGHEIAAPIMGVIAALYTVALVSGVIVLLPSLVKDFFAVRNGKNQKRMWLDTHNMLGLLSLPFHLVMALTSVIFAFHDEIYMAEGPILWGATEERQLFRRPPPPPPSGEPLPLLDLHVAAQQALPDYRIVGYQVRQSPGGPQVGAIGEDVRYMGRGRFLSTVALDPATGQVRAGEQPPGPVAGYGGVVNSFFVMHFGTFGGTPIRWLYLLLGLAGAFVFYSGNLIWIESRRRRARKDGVVPEQRRDMRWLAAGTVGVCLGCVCGISAILATARWLPGWVGLQGEALDAATLQAYYAVFLGCIGRAFWRGAPRASVDLLWLGAMLTLGIPLSTLLSWALPASGGTSAALQIWGVDATALVAALVMAWLARMTARRAQHGDVDSVWSSRQPATGSSGTAGSSVPAGHIGNKIEA